MAKKVEQGRRYRFKDAQLVDLCDKVHGLFKRDSKEFVVYGYEKETTLEKLNVLKNSFVAIKSDDYMKGKLGIATEHKDRAADELMKMMTTIRVRAKVLWGERSAKYKMLPTPQVPHKELPRLGNKYLHVLNEYLNELREKGITQELITVLNKCQNALESALDAQAQAKSARDMLTEERKERGNELYGFISELCEIGKDIWGMKNDPRYTDYVVYSSANERHTVDHH